MEPHNEVNHAPLRAAASVVMLRDTPAGLETFLIKRHGLSDVLGGAYVFPGGKVDREDAALDLQAHLDQPAGVSRSITTLAAARKGAWLTSLCGSIEQG